MLPKAVEYFRAQTVEEASEWVDAVVDVIPSLGGVARHQTA